jgi:hypothetical protein
MIDNQSCQTLLSSTLKTRTMTHRAQIDFFKTEIGNNNYAKKALIWISPHNSIFSNDVCWESFADRHYILYYCRLKNIPLLYCEDIL